MQAIPVFSKHQLNFKANDLEYQFNRKKSKYFANMKKLHIQDFTKSELLQNFDLIKELSAEKVTLVNITTAQEYTLMNSIDDCHRYIVNQNMKFNVTKISIYEKWVKEDLKEMSSLDGTCIELFKER